MRNRNKTSAGRATMDGPVAKVKRKGRVVRVVSTVTIPVVTVLPTIPL